MKILVIGQGGREHAIVKALRSSPSVTEVHVTPGSSGMAREALCHFSSIDNPKAGVDLCRRLGIDLVVIGPEAYLAWGWADELRSAGFDVFGPGRLAARLEASKSFAKKFMIEAGVPTGKAAVVSSVDEVWSEAEAMTAPYVLKADGLAAGKGVFICPSKDELMMAARRLFEQKELGAAGVSALLEEYLVGEELSYLIVTNGHEHFRLPLARDHKRLADGDQGPNTGGMGAVAPEQISEELDLAIIEQIVQPTLRQISRTGLSFRGVLYFGLMLTSSGPKVLEYNVRFGDPEAQVLLPLLDGDWGKIMRAVARGEVPQVSWRPIHSACVVLAAERYPDSPVCGVRIEGQIDAETPASYFLHAGTAFDSAQGWTTNGGRVLNALGLGNSREEALRHAYELARKVSWPGRQMRSDIGRGTSSR